MKGGMDNLSGAEGRGWRQKLAFAWQFLKNACKLASPEKNDTVLVKMQIVSRNFFFIYLRNKLIN